MAGAADLPEITEVKRLSLRPGDSLLVRLDREPDEFETHDLPSRIRALLGADVPVIVLGPEMDIEVLERAEEGRS